MIIQSSTFSSNVGPVMEDWDIISPKDVIGSEQLLVERTRSLASAALPFTQSLLSQVHSPVLIFLMQSLWVRIFAYAFVSLVFRWAGPCPGSSRPSAGLMGRRSSLSSPLWATQSFTVTLMDRASWHDLRNSGCGSTMVVWSRHCARCSTCVLFHHNSMICTLMTLILLIIINMLVSSGSYWILVLILVYQREKKTKICCSLNYS